MKRKSIRVTAAVAIFLSVPVALALAAQDKYTVRVPHQPGRGEDPLEPEDMETFPRSDGTRCPA
jgi:hypothetical protein